MRRVGACGRERDSCRGMATCAEERPDDGARRENIYRRLRGRCDPLEETSLRELNTPTGYHGALESLHENGRSWHC